MPPLGALEHAVDFKLEPPLMQLGGGMMVSGSSVMSLASSLMNELSGV